MQVDVDLSGRIEDTKDPSVVAMANSRTNYCIRIEASDKKIIIKEVAKFRRKWDKTRVHIYIFATLLFLLLKDHLPKLDMVLIDPEYTGHDNIIKNQIMQLCKREGVRVYKDQIGFKHVGKKSPSHDCAYNAFKDKKLADLIVDAETFLKVFKG